MIRLEIRCSSPSGRAQRSGSLVLDLHNISVEGGATAETPSVRFVEQAQDRPLMKLSWNKLILAYCLPNGM